MYLHDTDLATSIKRHSINVNTTLFQRYVSDENMETVTDVFELLC